MKERREGCVTKTDGDADTGSVEEVGKNRRKGREETRVHLLLFLLPVVQGVSVRWNRTVPVRKQVGGRNKTPFVIVVC